MEKERRDPKEKKCAACGKDMYAGEDWAYKRRTGGERTKWFCSYKCMRAFDAKHDGKNAKVVTVDEETAAPKEPVSRAVLARALAKEIKNGGSVIAYLTAEGYKNPYEAYNAVRHYCETKAPELAEVLKPLRELPKGPQKKTGRPRKRQVEVETVDQVPPVEPVQCIAHVTAADIEEVHEAADANRASFEPMPLILRGGVDYQLKVAEAKVAEAIEADRVQTVEITAQQIQPMGLQGGVDYQPKVDEAAKQEAKPPMNAIQRLAAAMNNMPREIELRAIKIESGLGTYTRGDVCRNVIYFRREIAEGDVIEVAMTEDDWRQLARELPKVMRTMGVEV